MANASIKTLHSFLREHSLQVAAGGNVVAYSHDQGGSDPVLCLVHGWPQSSFCWRHVVPLLKDKYSLFVPELPGYGYSSPPPQPDKRTVGGLLIEALQQVFGKNRPVIWIGHDRGGRIGHRLVVDGADKFNIKAAVFIDIVPTLEQFRAFANPRVATAYYHWSFLPLDNAPHLIEGMGGHAFFGANLQRMLGSNDEGRERIKSDHALDNYCHQFSKPETIAGSCADYRSAAETEWQEQEADQAAGRKVKVPLMVLYAAGTLGRMHNVPARWKDWVDGELRVEGIGDGYGHFLPEECAEIVVDHLSQWVEHVRT